MRDNLSNLFDQGECISEEMMLLYLEKKLPPAEQHRVEKHLLACELCDLALQGLSSVPAENLSAALDDLDKRMDESSALKKTRIPAAGWFYRAAAVIALLALFGGGYYYLRSLKKSEKSLAENSEPRHDTLNQLTPGPKPLTGDNESSKEEEEKTGAIFKKTEQKKSGDNAADLLKGKTSPVQNTVAAKEESGNSVTQTATTTALRDKEKKETTVAYAEKNDLVPAMAEGAAARSKQSVGETNDKVLLEKKSIRDKDQSEKTTVPEKDSEKGISRNSVLAPAEYEYQSTLNDTTRLVQNQLLEQGILKYESKKYAAAIDLLQRVLKKDTHNTGALFYSGVSYLCLNDTAKAIAMLESVLKNPASHFSDGAKWNLSQVFLKQNKKEKAITLMEELSHGNGEYRSRAQTILDGMK